MGLETATYISDLVITNPVGATDTLEFADDHIRLIKSTLKTTFPNVTGAMTSSHAELNILDGATLSTAELNILDGFTGITADLNILSGASAAGLTATEIQYVNGVTSAIQTQFDSQQTQIDSKLTPANQGLTFLGTLSASASATIDFTSLITSTYDAYLCVVQNAIPATNGRALVLRVSTDNGSTFVSGANTYKYALNLLSTSAASTDVSGSATVIKIATAVSNTASFGGVNAYIYFNGVNGTTSRKGFVFTCNYDDGSDLFSGNGAGFCTDSTVVTGNIDAIRFLYDSGNITSGTFTLYGLRKS